MMAVAVGDESVWTAEGLIQAAAATIAGVDKQGDVEAFGNRDMEYRDRLEFALEATGIGLWSFGTLSEAFEFDAQTKSLWGLQRDGAVPLGDLLNTVHRDDATAFRNLLESAGQAGSPEDVEIRIRRADGAERWIAMRARMTSDAGTPEIFGTARDITDIRTHDQQIHLLMREVTHRSKNLLAIIQAMARQTVKDSLTAADFEQRFSLRLRGLSFSHELLAEQDWRGAALEDLTRGHLWPILERHKDRLDLSGPSVFIRPEAAQNIGLALNELTSNTLKFGALSGPTGRVSVQWYVDTDPGKPRWLHVVWNEYGGAVVEPPLRQGFGHKVMERVVARALDGVVNMTFAPTGLQWSLRIPIWYVVHDASE